MSEYQYYEFRAVDKPLTSSQMGELRALSSRATITPTRFTNTYNYSGFRGNPAALMKSYYDAHVYVSNFGTVTFMLRLPQAVLPAETLAPYLTEYGLSLSTTEEYTILEWQLEDEPSGEWMEGEGWMDRLLPIRNELAQGDYRSLYIGWLSSASDDEEDDEDEDEEEDDDDQEGDEDDEDDHRAGSNSSEPPVPAGLGSLTDAQAALAEFLGVSGDIIAAAAEASLPSNTVPERTVAEWVGLLPEDEIRGMVVRIVRGEAGRVQAELQSRYHRAHGELREDAASGRRNGRTIEEIYAKAEQLGRERMQRLREDQERKRHAYLDSLVPRFSALWANVYKLVAEQNASAYDKVCTLLVDLRDAYRHAEREGFEAEFARFYAENSRRTALVRRLKEARLVTG